VNYISDGDGEFGIGASNDGKAWSDLENWKRITLYVMIAPNICEKNGFITDQNEQNRA
jgi:hypothetical protein